MSSLGQREDPFPNGKPNHDLLQNLSFMYQANIYLNGLGVRPTPVQPAQAGPSEQTSTKKPKCASDGDVPVSSAERPGPLDAIARRANRGYEYATQHSMLKTDPSIKRTFCSKCYTVLIPGVTCKTRIRASKKQPHRMTTTCNHCSSQSSLLAPPHHPPLEPELNASETSATALVNKPLDGPVRHARRRKLVRPVPFWQKADHLVVPTDGLHRYVQPVGNGEKQPHKRQPKQEKGKGKATKGEQVVRPECKQQKGRKDLALTLEVQPIKGKQPPTETLAPVPERVTVEMDEEEMMNML